MSRQTKPRVMYMHTLDGAPAAFGWTRERRDGRIVNLAYIYFASWRRPIPLVPSLRRIRTEQRWAMKEVASQTFASQWAHPRHYGYVRVEVPS